MFNWLFKNKEQKQIICVRQLSKKEEEKMEKCLEQKIIEEARYKSSLNKLKRKPIKDENNNLIKLYKSMSVDEKLLLILAKLDAYCPVYIEPKCEELPPLTENLASLNVMSPFLVVWSEAYHKGEGI